MKSAILFRVLYERPGSNRVVAYIFQYCIFVHLVERFSFVFSKSERRGVVSGVFGGREAIS